MRRARGRLQVLKPLDRCRGACRLGDRWIHADRWWHNARPESRVVQSRLESVRMGSLRGDVPSPSSALLKTIVSGIRGEGRQHRGGDGRNDDVGRDSQVSISVRSGVGSSTSSSQPPPVIRTSQTSGGMSASASQSSQIPSSAPAHLVHGSQSRSLRRQGQQISGKPFKKRRSGF